MRPFSSTDLARSAIPGNSPRTASRTLLLIRPPPVFRSPALAGDHARAARRPEGSRPLGLAASERDLRRSVRTTPSTVEGMIYVTATESDTIRAIEAETISARFARGWHCLGLAEKFKDGTPHTVDAFGQRLVVFTGEDGTINVLDAY